MSMVVLSFSLTFWQSVQEAYSLSLDVIHCLATTTIKELIS